MFKGLLVGVSDTAKHRLPTINFLRFFDFLSDPFGIVLVELDLLPTYSFCGFYFSFKPDFKQFVQIHLIFRPLSQIFDQCLFINLSVEEVV